MTADARPLILCTPHCDVLGHAGRTLRLATALRDALPAYRIEFAGGGQCVPLIEREGFRVHPLIEVLQQDWKEVEAEARGHRDMVRSADQVRDFVREEIQLFERLRPSLVIGDHRYTVFTSTEVARVPLVAITNAFYTRYSSLKIGAPKALFPIYSQYPGLSLLHPFVALVVGPFVPRVIRRVSRLHCAPYDIVRGEYGLGPHRDLFDFYSGDQVLLPDWPEICPTEDRPDNYHYVGMFGWSPVEPLPADLALESSMIYVTLGSTGRTEDFAKLIRGLQAVSGHRIVVTTGPSVTRGDLGSLPGNVRVEPFLPGEEVLKRSVLAVHHGGMGVLGQCLDAGVAMVCIPGNIEQEVMAAQFVSRRELGLVVERYRLTPAKVTRAIRRVLAEPRFRENAAAFASRLKAKAALRTATEKVCELLADRPFLEAVRRGTWTRL